jgi:C1A family cysteine protease
VIAPAVPAAEPAPVVAPSPAPVAAPVTGRGHRTYNLVAQPVDARDFQYAAVRSGLAAVASLPAKFDLRTVLAPPPCYDQGQLGSCTAHATKYAYHAAAQLNGVTGGWNGSALFIYYTTRVLEGTVSSDAGATLRDVMKAVNKTGVASEALWPYSDGLTLFKRKPSPAAYTDGLKHRALTYAAVANADASIKQALTNRDAVIIGFVVYDSFENDVVDSTGQVPMPGPRESVLGGHAVCIVGWDDTRSYYAASDTTLARPLGTGCWIVRNSWGTSWGDHGYCYMPYPFLRQNGFDFWALTSVTDRPAAPVHVPAPAPTPAPVHVPAPAPTPAPKRKAAPVASVRFTPLPRPNTLEQRQAHAAAWKQTKAQAAAAAKAAKSC